ncbi:histone deacetylase 2 isoform X1 [Neltuma alba]|uniref:histone deacetylase 2 isoform X1 n=1 Tax=Neltuma alba TaxID=207710 RepID=UPI0010A4BC48|nr:histone deacetylase 2-like isoform X1 [Prosopis alba]
MNSTPSIIIESTRNLRVFAIFLLFTVATVKVSHVLYRYLQRNSRFSSNVLFFVFSRWRRGSSTKPYPFKQALPRCPSVQGSSYLFEVVQYSFPGNREIVHSESYLNSLKNSSKVAMMIEVPPVALFPNCLLQHKVLFPFRKQVGGTILAAKLAKERGWAINIGGGFHHCSAEKGGGFCVYADISLCIRFAFVQLNISRVMIIDLDAHQGNGHEMDLANDDRVYILDMYNLGIYPFDYEARRYINQIVEVESGTRTEDYLQKLDRALEIAGHMFDPELVVYNAGTDILDGDPLGRLKISPEGIALRDEKVFQFACEKKVPIVMLTSGGYMKSSARVIADSIVNLSNRCLIDTRQSSKFK